MRIGLITMSFPWAQSPASGVYNLAQAKAFNALTIEPGGERVTCEVFAPTLGGFSMLEGVVPKLRAFNMRPADSVLEGVRCRVVKGVFPRSPFLRWHVAPRQPRLAAWTIARSVERRLLAQLREFKPDALLVHDGLLMSAMTARLAKSLGVPFGVIEHDPIDFPRDSTLGRYYLRAVSEARAVFSVGLPWYLHLRDTLGLKQARLVVNGTVMATPEQIAAPRPERWAGKRLILCVGSFIERKGHRLLIESFAEADVSNAVLVITGEPPAELRELAARLGVSDRVEFIKSMPQREVLQYMAWADVFALPSWWESFGLVYAEAMSACTPVIMSSDCGMAHHIRHGEHGWILPVRDKPALVRALGEAFDGRDLRAMGRAGRALVERKLTWERNAQLIVSALRGGADPDAQVPPAARPLEQQRFTR